MKIKKMLPLRKIVLGLSLLAVANVSLAAPIMLTGNHFTVTYDSVQAGIYGAGAVSGSGDTVFFTPTQFKTSSGSGPASVPSTLTLTFSIIDPGYGFAGLSYMESGDYFLLNGAAVDVAASVKAENAATSASTSLALSPGVALDVVTSFANFRTTDWLLTGDLSLLGLGANTLQITLDNTLFASTPAPGFGFIEKKYVGLSIVTEPGLPPVSVPEPSSWALLFAGMMAALLVGRRRGVRESETSQCL